MIATKLVSKMKWFVCVLLLSVLGGLYAMTIDIDQDSEDEHQRKILELLNVSAYQVVELDDQHSENKSLVRVRRSQSTKIYRKDCEKNLALVSTLGGGAAGAGGGAAAGAIAGSVVPGLGTAAGALVGNVCE